MAYATLDDIKKLVPADVLVELTDDEGMGEINAARVDEAVSGAQAEVNGYCAGRYAVPFAEPVPDVVRKLAVDIAVYTLYSRAVRSMPEVRAERYRAAIRQLEAIAKGTITLGADTAPSSAPEGGSAETNKPVDTNVFSRESLRGF